MKRKLIIISVVIALIVSGVVFFNCVKIDYDNLIRMPVKRNVILDYNDLVIKELNVNSNNVIIKGELNAADLSLEVYTISTVDVEKKKDVLYITVCGGYGVGEDEKKFTIDEQFDGEEIKKIVLKGRRFRSDVIWKKQ